MNALANGLRSLVLQRVLIQSWLLYTPEFQLSVELISSPLSLLVALWGMTSKRALQAMKRSGGGMVSLRGNPLLGQGEGR